MMHDVQEMDTSYTPTATVESAGSNKLKAFRHDRLNSTVTNDFGITQYVGD